MADKPTLVENLSQGKAKAAPLADKDWHRQTLYNPKGEVFAVIESEYHPPVEP